MTKTRMMIIAIKKVMEMMYMHMMKLMDISKTHNLFTVITISIVIIISTNHLIIVG